MSDLVVRLRTDLTTARIVGRHLAGMAERVLNISLLTGAEERDRRCTDLLLAIQRWHEFEHLTPVRHPTRKKR